MSQRPPRDLYASFLAVRRTGSLSAAARALGVAQPTIRRHIETLEEALGAPLFTRTLSGVIGTETATRIAPYAETMEALAEALVRAASAVADPEAGTVRLTCSEVMAVEVLPGLLQPLMERHPGLALELVPTDRNRDLLRRDADIAVRMARPGQGGLIARRLRPVALGLFASRAYLGRRRPPGSVAALRNDHRLVGQDSGTSIVDGLAALGVDARGFRFVFRCDSDAAQLAAIRAGIGIGICQCGIGRADPALAQVLPEVSAHLDVWLVTHEDLRNQLRIRLVMDHLALALGEYARSGDPPAATTPPSESGTADAV